MTCDDFMARLAARSAGEELPGSEALDAHLASCASCFELSRRFDRTVSVLRSVPAQQDPARRDRLKSALAGRASRTRHWLAVAAMALIAVGSAYWWFPPMKRKESKPPPGAADPGTVARQDWRLAWIEQASARFEAKPKDPPPRPGGGEPSLPSGGMEGRGPSATEGESEPTGSDGKGWVSFKHSRSGIVAAVRRQVAWDPWFPPALPAGFALVEIQALRPAEGRTAVAMAFLGGGSKHLFLFEEAFLSSTTPLPECAPGRRLWKFRQGNIEIAVVADGFSGEEWECLRSQLGTEEKK